MSTLSPPVTRGERELVESLRRGEESAFGELVERYGSSLLRLAMTFVPSRAVAEEVVQETWVGLLRGIEGFGAHSRLHTARILRLSEDLPVVIEMVDRADRIEALLPSLDEMIGEGLITQEKVEVISYRADDPRGGSD